MLRNLVLVMLALILAFNIASGQDGEKVRLRVMQLSYVSQGSAVVDIQIDHDVIFEAISFPYTTDYIELTAGSHTLATTITNDPDASASKLLMLGAGHSYSVVVEGDYREDVTFTVIDENNVLLEDTGSAAVLVNLTGQAITDIALDSGPVSDLISVDSYGVISLPVMEFTLSGTLGDRSYSETFTPHSNTLFLIAVRLLPSGDPQIIYQRSSPLTIADYLQSINAGAQFAQVTELLAQTDILDSLADDGEYTLFLPVNVAIDRASAAGIIPGAAQLGGLFASHITEQNLPPYLLPQHRTLTTLAENTISINFGPTDSGYWEIEGTPILWDVRLANGVIYGIDGVIGVSQ